MPQDYEHYLAELKLILSTLQEVKLMTIIQSANGHFQICSMDRSTVWQLGVLQMADKAISNLLLIKQFNQDQEEPQEQVNVRVM
jgi:hypothetical protein